MEEMDYRPGRSPLVPPLGVDCHVRDMTATISADVTLAQLQQKLSEYEQWLPIDGDPSQSVGTLASTDSTGPLRLGYGAWRDLLLGAQFLNGIGELISAGGRTMKNVAGYDLTKFMVGQRSIFGRLVTVTTRTYRRPAGALLARHRPDGRIVRELIPTSLRPHWAVLTSDALLCGYLGDEAAIAFYRSALRSSGPLEVIERSLEEDIVHRESLWTIEGEIVFRASVPPARLGEFVSALRGVRWSADAAFGIVLGSGDRQDIRQAARDVGGTVRFFQGNHGPPLELSTTGAEIQIIERLKHAFDPEGKLVPLPWRPS